MVVLGTLVATALFAVAAGQAYVGTMGGGNSLYLNSSDPTDAAGDVFINGQPARGLATVGHSAF